MGISWKSKKRQDIVIQLLLKRTDVDTGEIHGIRISGESLLVNIYENNYRTSPFEIGKSTISMTIFNSFK